MTDARQVFVCFQGDVTADDRVALDRPGFELFEHGEGAPEQFWRLEGCADGIETFHVLRVPAATPLDAIDAVVHALGRHPPGLKAWVTPD